MIRAQSAGCKVILVRPGLEEHLCNVNHAAAADGITREINNAMRDNEEALRAEVARLRAALADVFRCLPEQGRRRQFGPAEAAPTACGLCRALAAAASDAAYDVRPGVVVAP